MGAFLVMLAMLVVAMIAILNPFGTSSTNTPNFGDRNMIQAVAGNMVQLHEALVRYCTDTPASCAANAKDNVASQVGPFAVSSAYVPSFINTGSNLVNWNYYINSTDHVVVTYYASTTNIGGFSPAQIAGALEDYQIATAYTTWNYGLTASGAVSRPAAYTLPVDAVAGATNITSWPDGWVVIATAYQ